MDCRYSRISIANPQRDWSEQWYSVIPSPGRYWRSGSSYRLLEPRNDGVYRDYLVRDGRMFILRYREHTNSNRTLAVVTPKPVDGVGGEMWEYLLFSHWGPNPPSYYPLSELLTQTHTVRDVQLVPESPGQVCLKLSHNGGKIDLWLDKAVNYLARKRVMIPASDNSYRWEDEVVEFAEPAQAVFVPRLIEHRCIVKGILQAAVRTELMELKVNHEPQNHSLQLPGVAGMQCLDMDRGVSFRVTADCVRDGPETSQRIVSVAADMTRPQPMPPTDLPSATPWPTWYLYPLLCVVGATGVGIVWWRRRGRMAQY
jgi:hypothetical protein